MSAVSEAPADLGREYMPRVCCWHWWTSEEAIDPATDKLVLTGREVCRECSATCRRDPETRAIVDYETAASRSIGAELRARRRAERGPREDRRARGVA
jgi:hypothetical protein